MGERNRTFTATHAAFCMQKVRQNSQAPALRPELTSLIDFYPSFGVEKKTVQDKSIETDGLILDAAHSIEGATNAACDRISCAFDLHIRQMNSLLRNLKSPIS